LSGERNFYVEGYVVTTDLDRQGERFQFSKRLLEKITKSLMESPTVFLDHETDSKHAVGVIQKAEVRDNKIWVKILISKTEPKVMQKIKEGVLNGLSIGGRIKGYEDVETKEGRVKVITDFDAYEVSLVGLPANFKARTLNWYIKEAAFKKIKKLELEEDEMDEKREEIRRNQEG